MLNICNSNSLTSYRHIINIIINSNYYNARSGPHCVLSVTHSYRIQCMGRSVVYMLYYTYSGHLYYSVSPKQCEYIKSVYIRNWEMPFRQFHLWLSHVVTSYVIKCLKRVYRHIVFVIINLSQTLPVKFLNTTTKTSQYVTWRTTTRHPVLRLNLP